MSFSKHLNCTNSFFQKYDLSKIDNKERKTTKSSNYYKI